MTMSNQMALSAASVAVMANNNTLLNMGAMQESFFELDGSTINASLEATNLQAAAEKKSIMDQAEVQRTSSALQFSGAITGMAVTGAGLGMGISSNTQADALEQSPTKLSAGLTEMKTISSTPSTSTIELPETPMARMIGQVDPSAPTPVTKIVGMLGDNDQDSQTVTAKEADETDTTKKAEAATNPNSEKVKSLRDNAGFYMQNGNTFGGLLNTAVSSWGGIATYDTTIDQANQSKIKDLEAGLAQALSSQASLIGSQLGNLDQSRGNTYQLMSTLQQVRG